MTDKDKADNPNSATPTDDKNPEQHDATEAQALGQDAGIQEHPPEEQAESELPVEDNEPELQEEPEPQAPVNAGNTPKTKSRKPLMLIALGLLLIVITAVGWFGLTAVEERQAQRVDLKIMALQDELKKVRASIASSAAQQNAMETVHTEIKQELSASLGNVNNRLSNLQQVDTQNARELTEQDKKLDLLQQRVDGQQKRLASMSTTSREDWLLAEAEYLLRLANQRVMLERSPQNAIALLEAADKIIVEVAGGTGDADLFAIRQALARELAALKLVVPVDKEGVYLQLEALAEQVNTLPRVPGTTLGNSVATNDSSTDEQQGWWQRTKAELRAVAGVLDQYIKIEDVEAPPNPLVDGHIAQVVGLNLRIALEQAQVALLREDAKIYQQSMVKAEDLVKKYYIESDAEQQYLQQLETLSKKNVAPQMPDISNSLKLLHDYVQRLHRLQSQPEGQL